MYKLAKDLKTGDFIYIVNINKHTIKKIEIIVDKVRTNDKKIEVYYLEKKNFGITWYNNKRFVVFTKTSSNTLDRQYVFTTYEEALEWSLYEAQRILQEFKNLPKTLND